MSGARRREAAAEMVEAAFVIPLTVTLVLGLVAFGYAMLERSLVEGQLSSLGRELPDGWSSMTAEQVVRDLVLDGSTLDPARLTVSSASLAESTESRDAQGDPVAVALGADASHEDSRWVEVKATVSYTLDGFGVAFGRETFTRTVRGTYLAERRWEVS